jgi:hypothetical protein
MKGRPTVLIILFTVGLCFFIAGTGYTSCYFTANLTSSPTIFKAWISDIWVTTNTTEFNAGVPVNVNTGGNEVKLNFTQAGFSYIYSLAGGNTNNFIRYNISSNSWQGMANTLALINAGGALAFDGSFVYALAGGGSQNFTRYNPATNTWQGLNNTLAPINAGGALAFDGTYLYALAGGGSQNFTRYNPTTNTWQGLNNTLAPIVYGGSLAFGNDGFLYATAGGGTNFTRYNITTNTWESRAPVSDIVGAGGALTYGGGTFLYAMAGGVGTGGSNYWRYNITANTWTVNDLLQDTPTPPKAGGALTSDTNNFEYAMRGDNSQAFWRYNNQLNTWTILADTLQKFGDGGSLVYVPGIGSSCYTSPGSIASIVFDTTTSGSRWDVLAWNATIPSGTILNFEVRASDTLFDKSVVSPPSWISVTGSLVGGTYYVYYPVLPIGRYLQWRATLTSTVCANTPVLYDVTVYYTDP